MTIRHDSSRPDRDRDRACRPTTRRLDGRAARAFAPLFKALADPTRLEILGTLAAAGAELCVCDLEARFDLSQPTISHHLKLLRGADLVRSERRGTWVYYSLAPDLAQRLARCAEALGSAARAPTPRESVRGRANTRTDACCR